MQTAGETVTTPGWRGLLDRLPRVTGLTRDAGLALGLMSLTQALALAMQVILARVLGPAEFGAFSFAIAFLGICLIFAKCGLDTALVRLVAACQAAQDTVRLYGAVRFASRFAPLAGSFVGIVAGSMLIAAGKSSVPPAVVGLAAAIVPVAARSELNAAALRGFRRLGLALSGDGLVRPVVALGTLAVFWTIAPAWLTAAGALTAFGIGTCVSALFSSVILRRHVPAGLAPASRADIQGWLRLGASLMVANGSLVAMYAIDSLLLGILRSPTEAGFFSVAARIALFVLFVMNAAQLAAAPRIAAARDDRLRTRSIVRRVNLLSLVAGVVVSSVFLLAAEPLLGLFGSEFVAGAPALRILVLAQFINVLTGPTGVLLSMTGHERTYAVLLVSGLTLQVLMALWLIPRFGLTGAALAGLVAHAGWNLAAVALLRRSLGIDVTALDLLRPLR